MRMRSGLPGSLVLELVGHNPHDVAQRHARCPRRQRAIAGSLRTAEIGHPRCLKAAPPPKSRPGQPIRATCKLYVGGRQTTLNCAPGYTPAATKIRRKAEQDRSSLILMTFLGCSLLTALGVLAALVSKGPFLLALLLLIGAGALGLFPNYYAFGQEISKKHQGLVVGSLATFGWLATGLMQSLVGQTIQATGSYVMSMALMGLVPFLAFLVLWLFWERPTPTGVEPVEMVTRAERGQ